MRGDQRRESEPDTDRLIIVIEVLGEGIDERELDVIADDWVKITMPRGKYALTKREIRNLLSDLREVVAPYEKGRRKGG